jgi:hypothetical protein
MKNKFYKTIIETAVATTLAFLVAVFNYAMIEPAVINAVEDQFTITQTVTSEISRDFLLHQQASP